MGKYNFPAGRSFVTNYMSNLYHHQKYRRTQWDILFSDDMYDTDKMVKDIVFASIGVNLIKFVRMSISSLNHENTNSMAKEVEINFQTLKRMDPQSSNDYRLLKSLDIITHRALKIIRKLDKVNDRCRCVDSEEPYYRCHGKYDFNEQGCYYKFWWLYSFDRPTLMDFS